MSKAERAPIKIEPKNTRKKNPIEDPIYSLTFLYSSLLFVTVLYITIAIASLKILSPNIIE